MYNMYMARVSKSINKIKSIILRRERCNPPNDSSQPGTGGGCFFKEKKARCSRSVFFSLLNLTILN